MSGWEYTGWIPCLNGHLDFGLMRVGLRGGFTNKLAKDPKVFEANFSFSERSDSHHRGVILQSKVDWRDSPDYEKHAGEFRVLVVAEVNNSDDLDSRHLSGDVLIYHTDAEPSRRKEREKMNVHELCHSFGDHNRWDIYKHLRSVASMETPVSGINDDYFMASLRFAITPSGIVSLKYNEASTVKDEVKFVVARQAFYYLKYSVHTHKHHQNAQDSLTTIVPIKGEDASARKAVGLRLVGQLKRELTRLSRTQSLHSRKHPTSNSTGIIAYAESLITSLFYDGAINERVRKRELERCRSARESFFSLESRIESRKSEEEIIKSKSRVWLSIIAIFIWACVNYYFDVETGHGYSVNGAFFDLIPVFVGLFLFSTYCLIKRYYRLMHDDQFLEKLYSFNLQILVSLFLVLCSAGAWGLAVFLYYQGG